MPCVAFKAPRGRPSPRSKCQTCGEARQAHSSTRPDPPPWRLLKIREVAERLSVERKFVWGLIRAERIPVLYLAPRVPRIREGDLTTFMESL